MADWNIADVVCKVDLQPERVTSPASALRNRGAIVVCNHDFLPLPRATWDEAEAWLLEEEEFCRAYAEADDGILVEEREEELYEDDREYARFDIGIASSACCLRALGAMPYVSCSGGWPFDQHHETHPVIGFFAGRPLISAFIPFARSRAVGLENTEPAGALLYGRSIPQMVGFARAMFDHRAMLTVRRPRRPLD